MDRNDRRYWWLVPVLLSAAWLRFHQLGGLSLWSDELATWVIASANTLPQVISRIHGPSPPGYYLFTHYLIHFVGDLEFILRFPPTLSGILSIAVLFTIGRRLFSAREGMIAATLLAVMWFGIYYSQEARAYSGLMLFVLLATYFWIVIHDQLKQCRRLKTYMVAGYITSATLAMYWHYCGLVLIGLQGLTLMVIFARDRKSFKSVLVIELFLLLAFSPWIPRLLQYLLRQDSGVSATMLRGPLIEGYGFLVTVFHRSRPLTVVALALIGLYAFKCYAGETSEKAGVGILLLLWLLLPITILYIKSLFSIPTFLYRYAIASIPAAYLLLSRAIVTIWQQPWNMVIFTGMLVSFMVFDFFFHMRYYGRPKEEFREIVEYVAEQDEYHKDAIVIGLVSKDAPGSAGHINYYLEQYELDLKVDLPGGRADEIAGITQEVCMRHPRYLWFISGHHQPDADFMSYLNTHFDLIGHQQRYASEVWLYEVKLSDLCLDDD